MVSELVKAWFLMKAQPQLAMPAGYLLSRRQDADLIKLDRLQPEARRICGWIQQKGSVAGSRDLFPRPIVRDSPVS